MIKNRSEVNKNTGKLNEILSIFKCEINNKTSSD